MVAGAGQVAGVASITWAGSVVETVSVCIKTVNSGALKFSVLFLSALMEISLIICM